MLPVGPTKMCVEIGCNVPSLTIGRCSSANHYLDKCNLQNKTNEFAYEIIALEMKIFYSVQNISQINTSG